MQLRRRTGSRSWLRRPSRRMVAIAAIAVVCWLSLPTPQPPLALRYLPSDETIPLVAVQRRERGSQPPEGTPDVRLWATVGSPVTYVEVSQVEGRDTPPGRPPAPAGIPVEPVGIAAAGAGTASALTWVESTGVNAVAVRDTAAWVVVRSARFGTDTLAALAVAARRSGLEHPPSGFRRGPVALAPGREALRVEAGGDAPFTYAVFAVGAGPGSGLDAYRTALRDLGADTVVATVAGQPALALPDVVVWSPRPGVVIRLDAPGGAAERAAALASGLVPVDAATLVRRATATTA